MIKLPLISAQQAPQQQTNPLDQLKDIHTPPALEGFEMAVGWWSLAVLLLAIGIWLFMIWRRKQAKLWLLKPARVELEALQQKNPDSGSLAELSALLKRICLLYFPKQEVASLSGKDWVEFLNQQGGNAYFNQQQGLMLAESAYRPDFKLAQDQWQALVAQSHLLIRDLVSAAASRRAT